MSKLYQATPFIVLVMLVAACAAPTVPTVFMTHQY